MHRVAWASDTSAKLERFDEIVEEARANGRNVLVFSFFIDVLEKLHAHLGEKSVGVIRGSVAVEGRQQLVDDLGAAGDGAVLLSQITAGGAGLNIQSASIVILCESQFKPTIENQAIARAHRMGQINTVDVYRLLGTGTADERMLQILGTKWRFSMTMPARPPLRTPPPSLLIFLTPLWPSKLSPTNAPAWVWTPTPR